MTLHGLGVTANIEIMHLCGRVAFYLTSLPSIDDTQTVRAHAMVDHNMKKFNGNAPFKWRCDCGGMIDSQAIIERIVNSKMHKK